MISNPSRIITRRITHDSPFLIEHNVTPVNTTPAVQPIQSILKKPKSAPFGIVGRRKSTSWVHFKDTPSKSRDISMKEGLKKQLQMPQSLSIGSTSTTPLKSPDIPMIEGLSKQRRLPPLLPIGRSSPSNQAAHPDNLGFKPITSTPLRREVPHLLPLGNETMAARASPAAAFLKKITDYFK